MIIDKLIDQIIAKRNPTVVGLDPSIDFIPEFIKSECFNKYGYTLKGVAEAFFTFNKGIIDNVYDIVPAVKPQVAMYEQYGSEGIEAYIKTINYAKEKGLIVIGDVKRGDVSTTAEAYSKGHLGRVSIMENPIEVYKEDFITINPYLGVDSVEPYLQDCKNYERGLFVLVKTSNPNSKQLQDLHIDNGLKLYEQVALLVQEWGEGFIGKYGFSSIGAVVGATHKKQAEGIRSLIKQTFFLVPGYGAQGGTGEDIAVCFNKEGLGAIVNSSRGIITAYEKGYDEKNYGVAAADAAVKMKEDLLQYISL